MYHYIPDLPNLVTLTGMLISFYGSLIVPSDMCLSIQCAIVSILLDNLDGYLARKQAHRTDKFKYFGQHLDCFADYVTKGFLPSTILYHLFLRNDNWFFLVLSFSNMICITLRYCYEFSDGERPRGITPDVAILMYGIIFLLSPHGEEWRSWLILSNATLTCYTSTMPTHIKIDQKMLCFALGCILMMLFSR
jgi:phosphatidylserine synthase